MRRVKRTISVGIQYGVGRQDPDKGIFQGGVPDPQYLEELALDVSPETVYDEAMADLGPTGKTQLEMRGSPRAYVALAEYLLALTEYQVDAQVRDPDYHDHFDEIRDSQGQVAVHLIVHAPQH